MGELEADWTSALAAHLDEPSEASLSRAYALGRRALAQGFGILDVWLLYDGVLKDLVLSAPAADRASIAAAAGNFFRELLSPFEMSFRGYREINAELRTLNEDLTRAYAELQAKQIQLVQAAKMASLGELVAGIAHEINNPLSFVVSHLATAATSIKKVQEALGDQAPAVLKEQSARAISRLHESQLGAERIRNLVLKLRTFSRLDEGERKHVSMRESVASVLTIMDHRLEGRIKVETHFGYPDVIDCFPGLLNQAILNLVSNAIDAIDGDGTISITTGADADHYVIAVADTGSGIPEALRQRVLEPFFTTKPVGQGTGLGLSITYSIVQRHHGTLDLTPAPGGGTVASIRFPLEREEVPTQFPPGEG